MNILVDVRTNAPISTRGVNRRLVTDTVDRLKGFFDIYGSPSTDYARANYSKRATGRAELAAKMIRNIGHPSEAVAKRMIQSGKIDRVKLTSRDIDNAIDIKGKSVAFLRGKSIRKRDENNGTTTRTTQENG